jgi:hypothetical protein
VLCKIGFFDFEIPIKVDTTIRVTENNIDWMVQLYENGDVAIQPIGDLPNNVIIPLQIEGYTITSIAEYAFSGYTEIKTVEIPETVLEIGDYAFWGCENLASVSFSNKITSLPENVFLGCSDDLIKNVKKYHPNLIWS